MKTKTCAACDCELGASPIRVELGRRTVEACCEECAQKLNEAYASARGPKKAERC